MVEMLRAFKENVVGMLRTFNGIVVEVTAFIFSTLLIHYSFLPTLAVHCHPAFSIAIKIPKRIWGLSMIADGIKKTLSMAMPAMLQIGGRMSAPK